MKRRFKAKRRFKFFNLIKWVVIIIIVYLLFQLFKFLFLTVSLNGFDERIIKYILNDNNSYAYPNKKDKDILNSVFDYATNDIINEPANLLATNFYYKDNKQDVAVVKDEEEVNLNIKEEHNNQPLVYIYNSHQTEEYNMNYMEDYNINPTVQLAAYIMKERLDKIGINTIVEDGDIANYLKENNMKYYQSYEASRYYLKETMGKYSSILLYIDLHRDAISHQASTVTIDGKDCAKIMFVIGKEYDTYLKNLENVNHLNDLIKGKYPTLTRGVLQKEGEGVNGVYNQDLNENIILIEIGGNNNSIVEVLNTLDLIAPIIGEYVNEKR